MPVQASNEIAFPVAARFEAWVCGRSTARIVGSNPTTVPCEFACVVRQRPLRRADHSPRELLPSVCVCVSHSVIVKLRDNEET
jgi:hypothetical protein